MIRSTTCLLLIASATVAGAGETGKTVSSSIVDTTGKSIGTATFAERKGGVEVTVKVSGLPPGKHGMHIHENGKCEPPGFATAGAHFNPTGRHHGAGHPEGKHAGDLPNLEVKGNGTAELTATAEGATLGKGKTSLLKDGGTALIIHAKPDDEKTDPTGNSGDRIACGVVGAS
ncbi:superoxide dismutase family protein [Geotalea toluenoxydans]|uniref:superoxide dismutase family protein n=1 Tax=Geotalea toluenoxydans TaxID=421624 RepID=UPI0006D0AB55|nr:superoxide dismutase family protein [Geotalea toluenoxydans]